ncbi:MAG: amino acid permease, partial [Acidimicrobiia bacterium]|nr:amino acid permease [Acidimicrobiia bacterium]
FPAVTGFTQGVSMSGDLKDPGRSLPRGTFIAVGLSLLVYVSVAVLLAANAVPAALIDDTRIMRSVASVGFLIDAGVIAATLSSAMASFLGAPRILQSLASDKVFPILNPFAKGVGETNNPRRGVLLSLVVALATVALGNLNAIAPVVSMFFIISYGLLNYATYFEARAKSPSFRPRFRFFDKRISLAGALMCLGAMLAINVIAGAAAVVVLLGIYQYLRRSERPDRWVDASHSHHFQRAKESIAALTAEPKSARNWRPQILAFSADPERRARLLQFATWLEGDSGLTAAVRIVEGDGIRGRRLRESEQEALEDQIEALDLDVHARSVLAADGMEALPVVVQSFGIGSVRANTALFGWPESDDPERRRLYVDALQDVYRLGVNVVSMSSDPARWNAMALRPAKERRIDVWWAGHDDTSRLALLAAYLFTRTGPWAQCKIRVLSSSVDDIPPDEVEEELAKVLEAARIRAVPQVLEYPDPKSFASACSDAALVLVPMRIRRGVILGPFDVPLDNLLRLLPMTAAIRAGAPIDLVAGPESGLPGQITAAEELLADAEARLRALESEAQRASYQVESLRSANASFDASELEELSHAEAQLARVTRRALTAQARVDAAKADVARLLAEL